MKSDHQKRQESKQVEIIGEEEFRRGPRTIKEVSPQVLLSFWGNTKNVKRMDISVNSVAGCDKIKSQSCTASNGRQYYHQMLSFACSKQQQLVATGKEVKVEVENRKQQQQQRHSSYQPSSARQINCAKLNDLAEMMAGEQQRSASFSKIPEESSPIITMRSATQFHSNDSKMRREQASADEEAPVVKFANYLPKNNQHTTRGGGRLVRLTRCASASEPGRLKTFQPFKLNSSLLFAFSLLIALALQSQALMSEVAAPVGVSQAASSVAPMDRSDKSPASLSSGDLASAPGGQSESDTQKSIVASLSSAVATAAAAAAVAAAQSSLSGGDGRSVLTGASGSGVGQAGGHAHMHSSHSPRSSSLNLAINKIADAIPEVPYNILHNMKKLDHAAPFYNVPNKLHSPGALKESTSSLAGTLLASALSGIGSSSSLSSSSSSAVGSLGGAAEQLTALFRSPIWKRISDSYGEFTSEFRSLFRAQHPTPMKGTTSSATTKLLRDISVPALLMLLASSIPSDWRPSGRNRRKSPSLTGDYNPVSSNVDPLAMAATSSDSLPSFTVSPQQSAYGKHQQHQFGANNFQHQQQPQQLSRYEPYVEPAQARVNDLRSYAADVPSATNQANWYTNQAAMHYDSPRDFYNLRGHTAATIDQQQQQQVTPALVNEQQLFTAQPQSVRRSGEIFLTDFHDNSKPAAAQQTAGAFGSLTSQTGRGLVNRLMNANGRSGEFLAGNVHKMVSRLVSGGKDNTKIMSLERRDQLGDKHRYSLVESDEQQSHGKSGKPFLLSAVTHALGSMLQQQQPQINQADAGSYLTGDKTINQKQDQLTRRQHQQQQHSAPASSVEQRDLSQLLPQGWKDVVKRTVNNVQQQATVQWKSLEGQLTSWVQDKLKSFPAPAASSANQAAAPGASSLAAPVTNLITSVSSTAMNMLGLGNKSTTGSSSGSSSSGSGSTASGAAASSALVSSSSSSSSSPSSSASDSVRGGKTESSQSPNRSGQHNQPTGAKAALAGVADLIVNTLTNRHPASGSSSSSAPKSGSAGAASTSDASHASSYPTLTGPQATNSASSTSTGAEAQGNTAPA